MKRLFTALTAAVSTTLIAQEAPKPETPPPPASSTGGETEPKKPAKRSLLKYTPPAGTAGSGARIDGDGASRNEPKYKLPDYLCTLTPKSGPALTTKAQPSLFAYMSNPVGMEFRVAVNDPAQAKPAFLYAVSQSASGIHRVDLSKYAFTLKPGVEYKWVAAVRPDPENGSADLPAFGVVKRIEPDPALVAKLKAAPPEEHAAIYAEAGIWYDALAALEDQIAANPGDRELLEIRTTLLRDAGLEKASVR